jgi:hypothetical protein
LPPHPVDTTPAKAMTTIAIGILYIDGFIENKTGNLRAAVHGAVILGTASIMIHRTLES